MKQESAHVQALRLGFSFSGLGETNTQAFGLAQVCRGTLIGQRAVAYWRARSIIRVRAVISRIRYCVIVPPPAMIQSPKN